MKKLQRLGLKVVQQTKSNGTTTTSELILPKQLFSIEEALLLLAGAMQELKTPRLSKTEVVRLRSLIQAASVYQVKIAEYIDYKRIEKELVELRRKYEEMAKRKLEDKERKLAVNKLKQVNAEQAIEVGSNQVNQDSVSFEVGDNGGADKDGNTNLHRCDP